MARTVRNAKIDTRSGRAKLKPRREPYWTVIAQGRAVGYRKGAKGGTWIARFRDQTGRQHYQALGSADDALDADHADVLSYGQAQEKARSWFEAEARRGTVRCGGDAEEVEGPERGTYTVGDAARDYLAWFARHRKSLRDTRYAVEAHILPDLGPIPVEKLTPRRLRAWHDALADAPARKRPSAGAGLAFRSPAETPEAKRARRSTANRILTVLKALLKRAHVEGRVANSGAWQRVSPFPQTDVPRVRYLSADECRRLLNACDQDLREMVRAALLTGCRYGELCRLTMADFDTDARTLLVREAKGGRPRHVPLDAGAAAFFSELCAGRPAEARILLRRNGTPWQRADQRRPVVQACERAGIRPAVSFHILRHTWASHRIMRGASLLVVSQVLGHRDTRMVDRHYGHLSPSFVRDAIEATATKLSVDEPAIVTQLRPAAG